MRTSLLFKDVANLLAHSGKQPSLFPETTRYSYRSTFVLIISISLV